MNISPTGIVVAGSPDAPTWGTPLANLASGASSLSAEIDNTAATVGHTPFDLAEVLITFAAAVTTGAGSPYVQAAIVAALDGTNYEASGVTNGQVFPVGGSGHESLLPGTAIKAVRIKGLVLPPSLFKVLLYNGAGAAFDATTAAVVYRMQGGIG